MKADVRLEVEGPVGEAWELSVEPDFPSRLEEGPSLDEVLRSDPALLGREALLGSTGLLVKLVDAKDDLSVQIHPRDDDPALGPGESGKPETWYVIASDPGAGLYLGFGEDVSRRDVEAALEEGGAVDALMTFVPVSPGDVFVIDPGTPHAIGRGVLLLEPQRVAPGKRGVTYRYWDWNRRYDPHGRPDPRGRPRALHRDRALDVTDWEGPRGHALIERIRYRAGPAAVLGSAKIETLAGADGPLHTPVFSLQRVSGCGSLDLPPEDRLRALTTLAGSLTIDDGRESVELPRGRTAALPASLGPLRIELAEAHAMLCSVA